MNLEINGLEIIKVDKKIKNIISKDIRKNISKKLNLKQGTNFFNLSKKISKLNEKNFNNFLVMLPKDTCLTTQQKK